MFAFKGLFRDVKGSRPYDIPRINDKTKVMDKCTLCFDRITNGMIPACVKSCPTGALTFGDYDVMAPKAKARVEDLKKQYPAAQALDADDVRVIFIVVDDPKKHHTHVKA